MPKRISPATLRAQDKALMKAIFSIADAIESSAGRPDRHQGATKPRALLVGGFVRDLLLKKHPKDADLEVYGVTAERLERLLKKLFPKRINAVGRSFGVFKINVIQSTDCRINKSAGRDTNNRKTKQSKNRTTELDVSLPRRESKKGRGHRGFAIHGDPEMTIGEAARRRDFTMNAMLLDPATRELIDPFDGAEDLKAHTLRVVDPKTFSDDPLRVWRALQFAARFGMEPDPKTTALLRAMVRRGDTDELPKERVTEEFKKLLLHSERPSIGLELARIIDLAERDLLELYALHKTVQDAGSHREGTAWAHTMLVVDAMAKITRDPIWRIPEEEKLPLMLTAVCHDFGKAKAAWRFSQGRALAFVDHPAAGGAPAAAFLKRFAFGGETNARAVNLTVNHRRGGAILDLIENDASEETIANELRKLLRDIRPSSWRAYLALCAADSLGVTGWDARERAHAIVRKLDRIVQKKRLIAASKKTLLSGSDLLGLGLRAGPTLGRLLAEIEHARDDGRIRTKREALALARMLTGKKNR